MDDNNKVLIEELEKRLIWYREEASAEEFDTDAVDAICTMLQKLSPITEPHRTKEEAYENIMKQIRLEEEELEKSGAAREMDEAVKEAWYGKSGKAAKEERHRRESTKKNSLPGKRGLRAAAVVIVVVGVMASLNMVTYAKENKSLFTMFLERVGVLKIVKDPEAEEGVFSTEEAGKEFYDSWADLDHEVKEKLVVPTYIPEGYALYGIKSWDLNDRKSLEANYYDQRNGHILIVITLWKDNKDYYRQNVVDESMYKLLSEYSDENTLYYEYEDEYICIVFLGDSFYRISGNITLEEMVKMGDGIGDARAK
ncbi:MAG: DUF4367 domain-containing protein [Lachnospiraceae bacterium]|nr:DUF4367 domain-containing protein [Lachnospiraceae bacterium]